MENLSHSLRRGAVLLTVTTTALLNTGCGKKSQIEYQAAQMRLSATEQQAALKSIEAESHALGDLGRYNYPSKAQISELKNRMEGLKSEGRSLNIEHETVQKEVENLQRELDDYLAKHSR